MGSRVPHHQVSDHCSALSSYDGPLAYLCVTSVKLVVFQYKFENCFRYRSALLFHLVVQLQSLEMVPKKTFQLNTGRSIPAIGFGTWRAVPNDAYESVKIALEAGYRHLDCAWVSRPAHDLELVTYQNTGPEIFSRIMETKQMSEGPSRTVECRERNCS